MVDPAELIVVGKITTVYGVKGWVKIHSFTDPMENLLGYQQCFLERGGQWQPLVIEDAKFHGKGLVALIAGVNDREQARLYCQCNIAVERSAMPELEEDEYYWHQLEGLEVYTSGADGKELLLGTVQEMMETGANDVLVVKKSKGSIDKRERLIPWLPDQVIKLVDTDAGLIRVDWDPEF
ncbi:ribosome maturation factor RimM [Oceanicoccus sp. KOV_DT_Chl]|uniref:ribosome maturation factor RimM n=1 Tax=Oceanicoccus sp. KOV_DT_Chl TaxID=1904639 RepID=UPI000C7C0344|nr:ribosome maturation factor RimM [Oceanicoccus sp. KOV_DT_Chl]